MPDFASFAAGSSVLLVGIITAGKYEGQHPIHPKARQILLDAFDQGWADPTQISSQGRQAQALLAQARESIAKSLGLKVDEIELWGEPELISPIAIWGRPDSGFHPLYMVRLSDLKLSACGVNQNNLLRYLSILME